MTQMKSVGETMAIGRTFRESFQKALRGLEVGAFGLGSDGKDLWGTDEQPDHDTIRCQAKHAKRRADLLPSIRDKEWMSIEEIHSITNIDRMVPGSSLANHRA